MKQPFGKHRLCSRPGQRLLVTDGKGKWTLTPPLKAVCGKVVRVTSVKFGDIRTAQTIVVIQARGRNYGVPVTLKLKP